MADVADKLARHEGLEDERRTAQIKRWSEEAAEQFVDAPVQTFVRILVEHIVRNRMMESRRQAASPLPASQH
ncbi:three-helix bundle dimerization domain-containing protein [Mycobacterium scrofulaceum]|uniref:three-helix bundle dimerization domain-containing protein n=1 Tax=Mycobacterium scrofulaceum TaxID=1783 RepID=UPI0026DA50C3